MTTQLSGPGEQFLEELDRESERGKAVLPFRHGGWLRTRENVLRSLHRTGQAITRIQAFDYCGWAAFVAEHRSEPGRYRLLGSSCHDRFCLPCQRDRARTIAHNAIAVLKGKPVRFVTLTVRTTTETLKEALDKLDAGFSKLRRRSFWRHHVTGGLAFTEVKWSETASRWHPHLHVLTHGRFIPQAELKNEWRSVTGDSDIVDIRLVRDRAMVLSYCLKYCGKGSDPSYAADDDRMDEAIRTLKGRRFLVSFGDFRGVDFTDAGDDDNWVQLGSLWEYLQRARDGDHEAVRILETIDAERTRAVLAFLRERSPPPLQLPAGTTWTQSQLPLHGIAGL